MSIIQAKQVNLPTGGIKTIQAGLSIVTGTSAYTTTGGFAGQSGGGTDTVAGVFTTAPQNLNRLIRRDTSKEVATSTGQRIMARTTFAASVFTTTLFISDGAGGELVYTPVAGDSLGGVQVDILYGRNIQASAVLPTDVVSLLRDTDNVDPSGGTSPIGQQDVFTATAAQTVFTLTQTPRANTIFNSFVNGQSMAERFAQVGTTVTYTPTDYALAVTDTVVFIYTR